MAGLEGILFEDSGQRVGRLPRETYSMMAGATVRETLVSNPVASIYRAGELSLARDDKDIVPADQARARIKKEGFEGALMVPDSGIGRRALSILIERKQDERLRQQIFENSPTGPGATTLKLAMGFAASLVDPLNIASGFVPVVGEARYARLLGDAPGVLRRTAVRAGVGAVEGTVGAAALEPIIAGSKAYEQADYTMADSILNVGFGGVFGAGLHVMGGALGDAWNYSRASAGDIAGRVAPETREAGLKAAIAQMANGERVNIEPLMNMDPRATSRIDRAPNLSAADRAIESRFAHAVESNTDGMVDAYGKIEGTDGGNLINTDIARELSPDYAADRAKAGAVHEPASYLTKEIYRRKLAEAEPGGEVVFAAGGAGSGKSTGLKLLGIKNQIVYDGTLSKLKSAVQLIDQALSAKQTARVVFTYRDPVEAFKNGAIPRTIRERKSAGSGRVVPLDAFVEGHEGARATIRQLMERYRDDERVKFNIVDNSRGQGEARLVDLDDLPATAYNGLREKLNPVLEAARASGALTDAEARGFSGQGQGELRQLRPEAGGELEPQRAQRRSDAVDQTALDPVRTAASGEKLSTVADEEASRLVADSLLESDEYLRRTDTPQDDDIALLDEETADILAGLKAEGVDIDMTAADELVAEADSYANAAKAAVVCGLKHA